VNNMICSVNGVIQKPGVSYTVAGSTITFTSNLVTGDVIDFIQILGSVLDLGTPSDNTVSLAKLTATGTKDATTFLRGDNSFAAAGGLAQVVSTNFTAVASSNSATFADVSNFNATITPSSSSNKILIIVDCHFGGVQDSYPAIKLFRGSTEIFSGVNASGNQISCFLGYSYIDTPNQSIGQSRTVLDSPNTTSETTYKIQLARPYSSSPVYINRTSQNENAAYTQSKTSGITLMEVTV
tara:strand:- start:165 stop:881 length:717 start_codon:yes stop_codon:yes gene_type:complete